MLFQIAPSENKLCVSLQSIWKKVLLMSLAGPISSYITFKDPDFFVIFKIGLK